MNPKAVSEDRSVLPRGWRRRDFLKLAAAAALWPLSRAGAASQSASVVVIGAGMAGLAACDRLQRAGIAVTVVEARDRIGGRIWTHDGIDLGASWIHGLKGNPMTKLARASGVEPVPFDYENMEVRNDAGALLTDDQDRWVDEAYRKFSRRVEKAQGDAGVKDSLGGPFDSFLASMAGEKRHLAHYGLYTNIVHEYAADPPALSLRYFDSGEEFGGSDAMLGQGYAGLLSQLTPPQTLSLGTPVREIAWNDEAVRVETDGSPIVASRALITLPLGVLRAGHVRFSPDLPAAKASAIHRLGMGTLDKLVLVFPRVGWPKEPEMFGYVPADNLQWAEWVNMVPVNGRPILIGFNGGRVAVDVESWSDREIVQSALTVLRKMFGADLPDPVSHTITRWQADPWALGSYSHLPPGSTPDDRRVLAEPVEGRVFFAGEACSIEHAATVHGAYLSGVKAAEEILAQTRG